MIIRPNYSLKFHRLPFFEASPESKRGHIAIARPSTELDDLARVTLLSNQGAVEHDGKCTTKKPNNGTPNEKQCYI
jgi:hypothetical protein